MKRVYKIFATLDYRWKFIITLIIKGLLLYHATGGYEHLSNNNYIIGFSGGDTQGYLRPIDHLLQYGHYDPDGRMPGYGMIYFIIRLFWGKAASLNILILLQLILTALSVVAMARIACLLFKSRVFSIVLYSVLTLSTYNLIWDRYLLTDSFCTSALVFLCYFIVLYTRNRRNVFLFYAGLMMAWIIFLRPVYAPVAFIVLFYLIAINMHSRLLVKSVFCFLIPVIATEAIWITRNYLLYERFIPFTNMEKVISKRTDQMWKFVSSYGGNIVYWHPGTEMRWFYDRDAKVPPPDIETTVFNRQDLENLRDGLLRYDSLSKADKQQASVLIDSLNIIVASYTNSIIKEHPYRYHVRSRLQILRKFLIHSGAYDLYNTSYQNLPVPKKITYAAYSFWHIITVVLGIAGLLIILIKEYRNWLLLWLSVLLVYCMFIHPFLRLAEYRYLVPCFPLLIFFGAYAIYQMYVYIKSSQRKAFQRRPNYN